MPIRPCRSSTTSSPGGRLPVPFGQVYPSLPSSFESVIALPSFVVRTSGLAGAGALLADVDAEGLHASVEVAAIHAHQFGGAGDVALGLGYLRADEVALVRLAGVAEGGEARGGGGRLLAAERREVWRGDALGRVHDDDAFD